MDSSLLPGRIWIERGHGRDYALLDRFHYRAARPASFAGVWVVRYQPKSDRAASVIAAAVLSWPTLACRMREQALSLEKLPPSARHDFVNQHVRAISRVVVHPTFRSIGLAVELVRRILAESPTRYVEALAAMGRVHPFFANAGMRTFDAGSGPVYYLWERRPDQSSTTPAPAVAVVTNAFGRMPNRSL